MDIKTISKIVDVYPEDDADDQIDDDDFFPKPKKKKGKKEGKKKIEKKKKDDVNDSDNDSVCSDDMDNLSIDSNLENEESLETGGDANPSSLKQCQTTMEYAVFAQKCVIICQKEKHTFLLLSRLTNYLSAIFPFLLVVASIIGLILKHKTSSFPIFAVLMKCSVGISLGLLFLVFCSKVISFAAIEAYYGALMSNLNTFSQTARMITFQPYSKHPFCDASGCNQEFVNILHDAADILQKTIRWQKRQARRKRRYQRTDD